MTAVSTATFFGLALCAGLSVAARDARAMCSKLECGSNSPYLAQYSFHELNFDGRANEEGLIVTGLTSPWLPFIELSPRVTRDRIVAVDAAGDVILAGAQLTGAYLTIVDSVAEPTKFRLTIEEVYGGFDLWVDPNGEQLESYKLSWRAEDSPPMDTRALCTLPPPQVIGDGQEFYPDPDGTLMFTGDRYDAARKEVSAVGYDDTAGWANIACPGGAVYKGFMTRHATASADWAHEATLKEKQALLKMYVSDVCGDGHAFTKQGTPLHWTNKADWGYVTWAEWGTEAWWGAEGALCLDTHRLGAFFAAEIAATCALPSCDAMFPDGATSWPTGAYLVSRLPSKPI